MNDYDELYESLIIPHNVKAEQSVLGSMLIDPSCITDVLGKAKQEDFYIDTNSTIFEIISEMHSRREKIDPVTVIDKMKSKGVYENDTNDYLLQLMQTTPTAANVMKYVDILKSETMRRELYTLSESVKLDVQNGTEPKDICAQLQSQADKIAESQTSNGLVSSLDACNQFFEYIDLAMSGEMKHSVKTGYGDIDHILGSGMRNGGLYILAARPGCGKTTLALQIAEKVAKTGKQVLFMSLEMSKEEITAKRLAVETGITYDKILNGDLTNAEYKKVIEALGVIGETPITINLFPSASVNAIAFLAQQVKNLGFVVIDYLGLIQQSTGKSLYEKTTETSKELKRLARTLNVPILCLAQLNREVEGRTGNKPRVSDLRDSGAIEQDADGIFLLYRNQEEQPENEYTPADLNSIVGKNRHGKTGEARLAFFLSSGRIYSTKEK